MEKYILIVTFIATDFRKGKHFVLIHQSVDKKKIPSSHARFYDNNQLHELKPQYLHDPW